MFQGGITYLPLPPERSSSLSFVLAERSLTSGSWFCWTALQVVRAACSETAKGINSMCLHGFPDLSRFLQGAKEEANIALSEIMHELKKRSSSIQEEESQKG